MTLPAQDIVDRREWLIRKDGYFYRPNCQGYTTRKIEAGRYTKAKADAEASVEPWHMSAVHQDDIPDEPAVADLNATISRLTADNEALQAQFEEMTRSCLAERAGRLAAESRVTALEAEVGRLREVTPLIKTALEHASFALDGIVALDDEDMGKDGGSATAQHTKRTVDRALEALRALQSQEAGNEG